MCSVRPVRARSFSIEIDVVGGTSIGAVMAAYVAADQPIGDITANARQAFATNPTGDFNLIPMVSLIKGLRLRRIVGQALQAQTGFEARVEDLWKSYYCVATNYSQAREQVVRRGPLLDALLASSAIPGALPPLISEGDLLCDGGTFNNFPVDVMRGMRGVGRVIGVDLSFRNPLPIPHGEVPGTWALLRDRLRLRHRRPTGPPSTALTTRAPTRRCSSASGTSSCCLRCSSPWPWVSATSAPCCSFRRQ